MQHFDTLENLSLQESWVTIGSFDGVHRGHRAILEPLAVEAHKNGGNAVVITFFPHPAVVLRGIHSPFYLTSPEEKAILMGRFGIDHVITLPFSREFAAQPAASFIAQLVERLEMRQIWAGIDFALGRNREGDIKMLEKLGSIMGFEVRVIAPLSEEGKKISSSHIRRQLSEGRVAAAADLLGRFYAVEGKVIHGDTRGASIGFPTANLEIWPERLLPRLGVYATWATVGTNRYPAVTNIGMRPTFEKLPSQPRLETHLLGFSGNLYGKYIGIEFVEFIRPETRFSSVTELKEQITKDISFAWEVFEHAH
ncbi:MAG: bifunctional riboflavin kinase/FAD synthetase [Anaerolineae bacterium]|nr:bifunctional riboflavin kinase/FAD synthetase [Anaerolineae bacterium]